MKQIHLQRGNLSAGLVPQIGGAMTYFRSADNGTVTDWMRPWVDHGRGPLDTTSFVMVPFFSWLEKDDFMFGDRHVQLKASGLGFERSLLGLGWINAWQVDRTDSHSATLSHVNEGGQWPWRYHARQTVSLDEDSLTVSVTLTNEDSVSMPAGIGLHTFFPWIEGLQVQTEVRAIHLMSEQGLPYATDATHPAVAMLNSGQTLQGGLDNIFEGWDGRCTLSAPGYRLTISAQAPYQFLCVNAPLNADYCCVEPVTHTTNAIHQQTLPHGETGFRLLAPGAGMTATARYQPQSP